MKVEWEMWRCDKSKIVRTPKRTLLLTTFDLLLIPTTRWSAGQITVNWSVRYQDTRNMQLIINLFCRIGENQHIHQPPTYVPITSKPKEYQHSSEACLILISTVDAATYKHALEQNQDVLRRTCITYKQEPSHRHYLWLISGIQFEIWPTTSHYWRPSRLMSGLQGPGSYLAGEVIAGDSRAWIWFVPGVCRSSFVYLTFLRGVLRICWDISPIR